MRKIISEIPDKEVMKEEKNDKKYAEGLRFWTSRHLIVIFMTLFMIMIVAPLNASTGPDKPRGSSCRHKQYTSYSIFVTKKKDPVIHTKKSLKKSKLRKHSFPV